MKIDKDKLRSICLWVVLSIFLLGIVKLCSGCSVVRTDLQSIDKSLFGMVRYEITDIELANQSFAKRAMKKMKEVCGDKQLVIIKERTARTIVDFEVFEEFDWSVPIILPFNNIVFTCE